MSVKIHRLQRQDEAAYEEFVRGRPESLFFASPKHRQLLATYLEAEDCTAVATDIQSGRIRGVLPVFRMDGPHGPVINSLPFYGSNGGVIADPADMDARRGLIDHFYEASDSCLSSTLIASPLDPAASTYSEVYSWTFRDERIGQLTPLPIDADDLEKALMASFHTKTRNAIRKAWKSEVDISHDGTDEDWDFLIRTHREGLEAVGGAWKPESFFRLIPDLFDRERDFRLYVARHDGRRIAALLLFYFNQTVEYYCPVTDYSARKMQPMSGLIFRAMTDATADGYRWWNWGGTWHSQKGVYDFKKRWGTHDRLYRYHIRTTRPLAYFRSLGRSEIQECYPNFYVLPFRTL